MVVFRDCSRMTRYSEAVPSRLAPRSERSASITASALSSKTSPWGWRLDFSRAFPLCDSFSAHPDQGSPPRISRWNAGVPPLIYAIPLRVFTITGGGHHDSPFDLPAWCGEARRPIRPSVRPGAEPPRYSGYRTCENPLSLRHGRDADRKTSGRRYTTLVEPQKPRPPRVSYR
jgi:hypothetical protein